MKWLIALLVSAVAGLALYSWALTRAVKTAAPAVKTPAVKRVEKETQAAEEAIKAEGEQQLQEVLDADKPALLDSLRDLVGGVRK